VLRIQGGGDRYFVAFNRKVGNNNETQEGGDQVMITVRPDYRHTELKATLTEGGEFIVMNFGKTNHNVTILVEKIDLHSTPAIAYIEIRSTVCGSSSECDDLDQCTEDRCIRGTCVNENILCSTTSPSISPCKNDAECNDGNPFTSDFCITGSCFHKDHDAPRNPKRGIGFSIAHGCDVLNNHDAVSWWYSWKHKSGFYRGYCDNPVAADTYARNNLGIEFVPMFNPGIPPQPFDAETEESLQQAKYLMALNEPERSDQANVTSLDAAKMWPEIVTIAEKYNLQIVAPCTTTDNNAKSWYRDWLEECTTLYGQPCKYDFTCFHSYLYPWPCVELPRENACLEYEGQQILDHINYWYDKFGKPVWITEFACNYGLPCDEETNLELMKQMVPILDASDKVFRYAWFSTNKVPSHTNQRVWETIKRKTCLENEWLMNNATDVGTCYRAALQNSNCHIPYAISFQKSSKECYCSKNACEDTKGSKLALHLQNTYDSSELTPLGEFYQIIQLQPSASPSVQPSRTSTPSTLPTNVQPSSSPSGQPSDIPSISSVPSALPSEEPSLSLHPSAFPSIKPSSTPTTSSPTLICTDDTTWKLSKGKDCDWVRKKKKRCFTTDWKTKKKANVACPIACKRCSNPKCQNRLKWKTSVIINGISKRRNCKYLKMNNKGQKYCGNRFSFQGKELFGYEACPYCEICSSKKQNPKRKN